MRSTSLKPFKKRLVTMVLLAVAVTILIMLIVPGSKADEAVHPDRHHISDFNNPLTGFNPFVDLEEGYVSYNNPRNPLVPNSISTELKNPDLITNDQNGLNYPSFSENIDERPTHKQISDLKNPQSRFMPFADLEEGNVSYNGPRASFAPNNEQRNPDFITDNQNVLNDTSFSENMDTEPTREHISDIINPLTVLNPFVDLEEGNVSHNHPQVSISFTEVVNEVSSPNLIPNNQNYLNDPSFSGDYTEEISGHHISDIMNPSTGVKPFVDIPEGNVADNHMQVSSAPNNVLDEVRSLEFLTKTEGTNYPFISGDGDEQHFNSDLIQSQQELTQLPSLEPNKKFEQEKHYVPVSKSREFPLRITGIKSYTDLTGKSNFPKNSSIQELPLDSSKSSISPNENNSNTGNTFSIHPNMIFNLTISKTINTGNNSQMTNINNNATLFSIYPNMLFNLTIPKTIPKGNNRGITSTSNNATFSMFSDKPFDPTIPNISKGNNRRTSSINKYAKKFKRPGLLWDFFPKRKTHLTDKPQNKEQDDNLFVNKYTYCILSFIATTAILIGFVCGLRYSKLDANKEVKRKGHLSENIRKGNNGLP